MPIHYSKKGDGHPLILIHGFCETEAIWQPLVNKLALSYQVITIDIPGFGKSKLPKSPISLMDVAEMIHEFLKEHGWLNSTIIGHSMGGYITLALIERHAQDYAGFGLFHSTALADSNEKRLARNKTIDFIKNHGIKAFANSFVNPLFAVANRKKLAKEIALITSDVSNMSQNVVIAYLEAMRDRPNRTGVLKDAQLPVLFIAGQEDQAVPIEKSRLQYQWIANDWVLELAQVGHMGMYEATESTFIKIKQFLDDVYQVNNEASKAIFPDRDLKKNLGCG